MAEFVTVAKTEDIPEGTGKKFEVNGRRISVWNAGGTFYAIDNACPHRGAPLDEGRLNGTRVTCMWHHWEIDVASGATPNPQARQPVFPVKVENGEVKVAV